MTLIGIDGLRAKGIDLDDTSIWWKAKSGEFPRHVLVGNKRAWVESEIDAYIESLIAKRDAYFTDVDAHNPVGDAAAAVA